MKSTDLGERNDFVVIWRLNRACDWAVHVQGQVCSGTFVVGEVISNDSFQRAFAEENDMVQAIFAVIGLPRSAEAIAQVTFPLERLIPSPGSTRLLSSF